MKLVDTSSWIHQIRRQGNPYVRARVDELLTRGDAAWCPQVRLELWSGVGSDLDRKILRDYESVLPSLPIDDAVWQVAYTLADRARRAGVTASAGDLLIAACARHHGVDIETADSDFERIVTL
jgi:predicted nucleic acid-binding protein